VTDTADLHNSRILVTGVTGQVATPLASALAGDNDVWGVARFRDEASRRSLERAGIRCVAADLLAGEVDPLPREVDYVLHFAVSKSSSFDRALTVNAEATGLLMRHCAGARAFFQCSSGAVYEPKGSEPLREDDPLGDNHRPLFATYSISKIAAEAVVRTCARLYDLPSIIARLNVPYGDGGGWPYWHLLLMRDGAPIDVEVDGPSRYNPIHDDDIRASLPALLAAASVPASIMNWAGEQTVAIAEWCAYLGELTGLEPRFEPSARALPSVVMDTSRLRALAGATIVDWRDGVRRMVDAIG
jgi:nucleoside-diphosphate-sugar epimerase